MPHVHPAVRPRSPLTRLTSFQALRMTGKQHALLRHHLFPGDDREAVALALCGTLAQQLPELEQGQQRHAAIAMVFRICLIAHDECSERAPDRVTWPTDSLPALLAEAAKRDLVLLKIHSHPGGFRNFSQLDDLSDRELFGSIGCWLDREHPHISAVMLPDGRVFARSVEPRGAFAPVHRVSVAGSDIAVWSHADVVQSDMASASNLSQRPEPLPHPRPSGPEFARRTAQAFGRGTTDLLSQMSAAVIGCSGTGSHVVEMLARLGIGRLVLVDPDHVEEKNMNRILNATMADVRAEVAKVDVLARAVAAMELGTVVQTMRSSLFVPAVVRRVALCDVVFGCMDSIDGRDLLNRLSVFYCLPYIDVGVRLVADGFGGIDQICGTIHYLQPDGSSLLSRGVYSPESLQAAALRRESPQRYAALLEEKYISGVNEERPAVISVNMLYASMAVNELLARLHPYREQGNSDFASYGFSLTQARLVIDSDGEACPALSHYVGRGDIRPMLNMPELSEHWNAPDETETE